MDKKIIMQISFWLSWMIIPIVIELVPALFGLFTLLISSVRPKNQKLENQLPRISLIIPVYNSADTLYKCIKSVAESSYPNNFINVIVANNQSSDNSKEVYKKAHQDFGSLFLQWIDTSKGKATALNSAIYHSVGKYIIHIDSDGILEKNALMNIVLNFENNPSIDAQTGTILTDKYQIRNTKKFLQKFIQMNEYMEYAQSFLAGRGIESHTNHLFTMSGAFSAFRRECLLQTKLYNVQTVGEDIDMTFQIKYHLRGKVVLCPEALFFVGPTSGLSHLYVQRQRWLRGELETIHYFMNKNQLAFHKCLNNYIVRRLIVDHTLLFLRIIWLSTFGVLLVLGFPTLLLMKSLFSLYVIYISICMLTFLDVQFLLKSFKEERKYYLSLFFVLLTLPLYYFICSFIQVIGIINAMTQPASWKTKSFSQEVQTIKKIFWKDLRRTFKFTHAKRRI